MRLISTALVVTFALSGAFAAQANSISKTDNIVVAQTQSGFQRWVKSFRAVALKNGVTGRTYDRAFVELS